MIEDVGLGYIEADEIEVGENVTFGTGVAINVRGKVKIGNNCYIGDNFTVNAEKLTIGDYFYNKPTDSRGMVIGGGGSDFPFAECWIGEKVTCHTGHINLARPVVIGNGVGLSHDVDIITHGFWQSCLEGFPRKFGMVEIGDGVIVGWKTTILPDLYIEKDVVIGSNSVVTKNLTKRAGIYAGNPAKLIGEVMEPTPIQREEMFRGIIEEFSTLMEFYDAEWNVTAFYPHIRINNLVINVEDFTCEGEHDEVTDAFRDFLRRQGIRVFHPRGFPFKLKRKK